MEGPNPGKSKVSNLTALTCLEVVRVNKLGLKDLFYGNWDVPKILRESCLYQPLFWKEMIIRAYGQKVISVRLDLEDEDMRVYAKSLLDNEVSPCILGTSEDTVMVIEELKPGVERAIKESNLYHNIIKFFIPSSVEPKVGTVGYVMEYAFEDPQTETMGFPETRVCLCHPSQVEESLNLIRREIFTVFNDKLLGYKYKHDVYYINGNRHEGILFSENLYPILDEDLLEDPPLNVFGEKLIYREFEITGSEQEDEDDFLIMYVNISQVRF